VFKKSGQPVHGVPGTGIHMSREFIINSIHPVPVPGFQDFEIRIGSGKVPEKPGKPEELSPVFFRSGLQKKVRFWPAFKVSQNTA
jgi:hypothetical protein